MILWGKICLDLGCSRTGIFRAGAQLPKLPGKSFRQIPSLTGIPCAFPLFRLFQ